MARATSRACPSSRLPLTATDMPSRASRRTIARPSPSELPETRATRLPAASIPAASHPARYSSHLGSEIRAATARMASMATWRGREAEAEAEASGLRAACCILCRGLPGRLLGRRLRHLLGALDRGLAGRRVLDGSTPLEPHPQLPATAWSRDCFRLDERLCFDQVAELAEPVVARVEGR